MSRSRVDWEIRNEVTLSFDSILTFIGISIAVLALIPRAKLLFIKIKLRWFDIVIVIISFLIIFYLLFYKTFFVFDLSPGLSLHRWKINPQNLIFIILLLLTLYLFVRIKFFTFGIRTVNKVGWLIDNLIQEEKYNDLILFLEKNFERLNKISERQTRYLKIRDRAKKKNYLLDIIYIDEKNSRIDRVIDFLLIPIRLLPRYEDWSASASIIISKVVLHEAFLEHIIKSHSYVFINFFKISKYYRDDFVDLFFRKLLADNRSILFIEIENSQNVSHYSNYWVIDSNKLVYYLFKNPKIAERLGIWQPVGEYVIDKLDFLKRNPELDTYNTNVQNFYDTPKWKSDIFVSIHFFDIMVSQALYKNVQWHMWLFYYRNFIEGIIKNHNNSDIYYDQYAEWPTKYEYLIYEIFSKMKNWLKSLDEINLEQENVQLGNMNLTINNGSIPISTMNVIGHSLKLLFDSSTISDHFKYYIFSMIFDLYFDLRRNESLVNYSKVLAKAILYKFDYISDNLNEYYSFIDFAFSEHFDKIPIPTELVREFEEILNNRGNSL